MKFRPFILFYLITLKQENAAFLNDAEQKIMAGLMETLSIDHTILLEEPALKLKDLQIYKRELFQRKATVYQNTQQILKYFWKKSFPAPRTLIIFKVKKFQTLITFFKTITRVCFRCFCPVTEKKCWSINFFFFFFFFLFKKY